MTITDIGYMIMALSVLSLIIYMGIVLCGIIAIIKILVMAVIAVPVLYKYL